MKVNPNKGSMVRSSCILGTDARNSPRISTENSNINEELLQNVPAEKMVNEKPQIADKVNNKVFILTFATQYCSYRKHICI